MTWPDDLFPIALDQRFRCRDRTFILQRRVLVEKFRPPSLVADIILGEKLRQAISSRVRRIFRSRNINFRRAPPARIEARIARIVVLGVRRKEGDREASKPTGISVAESALLRAFRSGCVPRPDTNTTLERLPPALGKRHYRHVAVEWRVIGAFRPAGLRLPVHPDQYLRMAGPS